MKDLFIGSGLEHSLPLEEERMKSDVSEKQGRKGLFLQLRGEAAKNGNGVHCTLFFSLFHRIVFFCRRTALTSRRSDEEARSQGQ